jgi:hypothetical protein
MRNGQHDNQRLSWSAASTACIDAYYGERPRETIKAIVIRLDGQPAAIIGMAMEGDRMRAFSDHRPELVPYLKSMTVLRAIKAAQRMFSQSVRPVIAIRGAANCLLERLGFVLVTKEVLQWRG